MRRIASAAAAKKYRRLAQPGSPVPGASAPVPHEPDVRFVDESGGVQGLARPLVGKLSGRELAQLVVDQRQELIGRQGVSALDG